MKVVLQQKHLPQELCRWSIVTKRAVLGRMYLPQELWDRRNVYHSSFVTQEVFTRKAVLQKNQVLTTKAALQNKCLPQYVLVAV